MAGQPSYGPRLAVRDGVHLRVLELGDGVTELVQGVLECRQLIHPVPLSRERDHTCLEVERLAGFGGPLIRSTSEPSHSSLMCFTALPPTAARCSSSRVR